MLGTNKNQNEANDKYKLTLRSAEAVAGDPPPTIPRWERAHQRFSAHLQLVAATLCVRSQNSHTKSAVIIRDQGSKNKGQPNLSLSGSFSRNTSWKRRAMLIWRAKDQRSTFQDLSLYQIIISIQRSKITLPPSFLSFSPPAPSSDLSLFVSHAPYSVRDTCNGAEWDCKGYGRHRTRSNWELTLMIDKYGSEKQLHVKMWYDTPCLYRGVRLQ